MCHTNGAVMLTVDFLEASDGTPLTKTFRIEDGHITTDPYPFVRNFTSHRVEAADLSALYKELTYRASQNQCMLKGLLREPIDNQSRAGLTNSEAPTNWVLLDLDFEDGWKTIDEFIADLNPAWADVSYIFQHSASAGIKYAHGLRGHIWIQLSQATSANVLKSWLKERNHEVEQLANQFVLSANGQTLKYPLDITTCQNDKLIYIAPPMLYDGIVDPIANQRFTFVQKLHATGAPPRIKLSPAAIDARASTTIESLRANNGLPKRKPKLKTSGALTVLSNPDTAIISSSKVQRGFVYVNLNGGDSWGYYFPEDKPTYLYNFKGEPTVKLADIDPEWTRNYVESMNRQAHGTVKPYVFRDPKRDIYYNVLYDVDQDCIELFATASSTLKLEDFMQQYGHGLPDPIPDWTVEFDPTTTTVIDPDRRWINLFKPTTYITQPIEETVTKIPTVINKILNSLCGNDEGVKDHFMNWLAYLYQTRRRTQTAWIFHGVDGTGKGTLLSEVLRPIFNTEHVTEWTTQNFEEQFNAPLEQTILLWMDELQVSSARNANNVMNKLKSYITENEITIRGMRTNAIQTKNWLNFIIATNRPDPVQLTETDRRFNVAPPQEHQIQLTEEEYESISKTELPLFVSYLKNYKASASRARKILKNEARSAMIVASLSTPERFFNAIRLGRVDYFMEYIRSGSPMSDTLFYQTFEQALIRWCEYAREQKVCPTPLDELQAAYTYIIGSGIAPAKFMRMAVINRIDVGRVNAEGRNVTGLNVAWIGAKQAIDEFLGSRGTTPLRVIRNDKSA
jgi:hypothetical protein